MTDDERAALSAKIAQLETLLDTGASSLTIDGMVVQVSLPQVRQRLRDLYRQRDGVGMARKIRLSGGWSEY